MIRSIQISFFFVASASAFSVVPSPTSASSHQTTTTTTATTTLFVKYANLGQMALAQDWGPAILQGGSDVGYESGRRERDAGDPDCYDNIEPECGDDVNTEPGCLVNSEAIGPYKVQGGAFNDWSSQSRNGFQTMSSLNEIEV